MNNCLGNVMQVGTGRGSPYGKVTLSGKPSGTLALFLKLLAMIVLIVAGAGQRSKTASLNPDHLQGHFQSLVTL